MELPDCLNKPALYCRNGNILTGADNPLPFRFKPGCP
jgi:hypothetical protein